MTECWQELTCSGRVWRLKSLCELWSQSLGFGHEHPSPSLQGNVPFGFRYRTYSKSVSSFQPPLVFSMIILNSLFPSAGCFISPPLPPPLSHIVAINIQHSQRRKTALDLLYFCSAPPTQGIQQYKWGQVWVIN